MDPAIFYGPCRPTAKSVAVAPGSPTQLCLEDHSRLVLILGVSGASGAQVSIRSKVASTEGLTIGGAGGPRVELDFSTHGPLVGSAWFANAAGATVVEVVEVFRDEDPERRIGPPPEV